VNKKIVLISLALLGVAAAFAFHFLMFRSHLEIQVLDAKRSPDGKWTAVVQMEVVSAGMVSNAVYAVRLKGASQSDKEGDLVINVPVNFPKPKPSIAWSNGKLVVTLADHQTYQYLASSVNGITVVMQKN
jgi:hypothetical protein